jgi:hypothetical protein
VKPSIRKLDGTWALTRPAFGFGQPEVTCHGSWKAARDALLGTAVGSAGPTLERATATDWSGWRSRLTSVPIRMEGT